MFSCPPSINKNKDLENWNSNIWRLWCREQVTQISSKKYSSLLILSLSLNKGTQVDPYNLDFDLIRNQNHFVELPENFDDIINYDGQIKINLTNGDSFSGNFKDGEREGFGVLTFGLIHQRYII